MLVQDANSKEDDADLMTATAGAVDRANTLEALTRPFLDLLHRLTGLDSTYLTEIRLEEDEQRIIFSDNRGSIDIAEGLVVPWEDTVCRRALLSKQPCVTDVQSVWPDSPAGIALDLRTYVSVPVVGQDDEIIGTLCGASGRSVEIPPEALKIMNLFARLIADQWERDRVHEILVERTKSAERRMRSRAMFLAEAEHKLKTPLTILRGWSDMLAENWDAISEDDRSKAIVAMQSASIRASIQVDEMLEEARSEVLSTQLEVRAVQLPDLLRRVAEEAHGATKNHSVVVDGDEEVVVLADDQALWQVLWHLTENAIKYSPKGGTIALSAHGQGSHAVITVDDEGLGIPSDIDLFAPFSRSQAQEFTQIGGTGLGLHIVRNLVQAMGGSVTAQRRELVGSRFAVTLPATALRRIDTSDDLLKR